MSARPGSRGRVWRSIGVWLSSWALLAVASAAAVAQQPALTPADYGRWERLGAFSLDPTGAWVVTSIARVDGNGELRLRRSSGEGDALVLEYGSDPAFSRDGRWMAYRKGTSPDAEEESDEPILDRLGLVDLASGTDTVLFDVDSFAFRDDGAWLAAHGVATTDSVGGNLLVLSPATGAQTVIGNVDDFAWQDEGELLAATLRTGWGSSNGVVLFDPDAGTVRTIESGGADYVALTWREESAQLAVMRSVDSEDHEDPTHDVLVWDDVGSGPARVLDAVTHDGLPAHTRVTPYAGIRFSEDGRTVFVGVRPWERVEDDATDGVTGEGEDEPAGGDTDEGEDEAAEEVGPADVQVWHWDDDLILRAQESRATQISRQTMAAAWHLDDRFVMLGDDLDEEVTLVAGGRWGVVPDYAPYLFERRFGDGSADWYRVDVDTGARTLIEEGLDFGVQSRFEGETVLLYDDDRWTAVEVSNLERTPIGDGMSFTRSLFDYDYPGSRPSWGVGGWVEDGSAALLYDKHDIWLANLGRGSVERLTTGAEIGRQYRVVNLDPEASRFSTAVLDPEEDVWLSVRDLRTKESGYARMRLGDAPETIVFEGARVTGLTPARDGDRLALRMERWDDSPDVFVGDRELGGLVRVTRTNPFQSDFAWGRSELLDYTTDAGHELQAILVYPANFRDGERYPLILYQYERLSDNLHRYDVPSERDYYNYQAWSQAGYFVLMPDIVYEPGRPGPSALDAVEHALDAAVATGHVDPDRMGLIGHSWGGYQAAYLPTRTDRFAASVAGAAITNFMSFMGAVHWNGGIPETGHWETGQARMAVPYWEDVAGHLESSPANFIADLETPLLLMHGDADGVVDFRQGLEFYNYARRAGKEVVLLVYPGADHGLREETQQVDYHRRIFEWFDYYLKGEPAAKWITDGESWVERAKRIGG
jgi:dipeptidyl aminopeptidase/acylaminoacyl peptidase